MIDFGLSDEYLSGYNARLKNKPFEQGATKDWKMGWSNANQALKLNINAQDELTIKTKNVFYSEFG